MSLKTKNKKKKTLKAIKCGWKHEK